eukprot:6978444-Prymnesium_polylepis.1
MANTCPRCIRSPDARTHADLHPSSILERHEERRYSCRCPGPGCLPNPPFFSGQLSYSRHPTSSSFERAQRIFTSRCE